MNRNVNGTCVLPSFPHVREVTDGKRKSLGHVSDYCACQHVLGGRQNATCQFLWCKITVLYFSTRKLFSYFQYLFVGRFNFFLTAYRRIMRVQFMATLEFPASVFVYRKTGIKAMWPTTVTAKANHSRQSKLAHGKRKSTQCDIFIAVTPVLLWSKCWYSSQKAIGLHAHNFSVI